MKQILVLGGGAAGLAAAIAAAETAPEGTGVLLLERNPRVGKKLLATGNGRCNLDNARVTGEDYFTSDRPRMEEMLRAIAEADPEGWFSDHGLLCRADEVGRIYPYSNQAADVLNLLLYWMERTGVRVRADSSVVDVIRGEDDWQVRLESGEIISGHKVICALGGSAGPQFGTDGFGAQLARRLGCKTTMLYPCLVPLKCRKEQITGLSGIRVKGDISLMDGDKLIHRESGEIQFTDYGLSGIAVMQLSGHLGQQRKLRRGMLCLDLFPQMEERELAEFFSARSRRLKGASMGDFMTGLIHRRVGSAVFKRAELGEESRRASSLGREEWLHLAHTFKNWSFSELEDTGWKNAQTTGGGVRLAQLDTGSFQVLHAPDLYMVGESVDCAGSCGGFNLHWAFGSGILAGRHAGANL